MSTTYRLDLEPVHLSAEDHEYVLGAYVERCRAAEADGRVYHLTDFVRDALIEASHR